MSRGSQIAIGIVSVLLGAAVLASALMVQFYTENSEGAVSPYVLFALAGISFCIAIACFFHRSRPVTMRLIGVVLLAGGVTVLVGIISGAHRSSGRGFLFAGALAAGGLWLAVTGKYPKWGAHGDILAAVERENAARQRKDP